MGPGGAVVGLGLVNKDFVACVPAWERDQKTQATDYFEQVGGPVPVALACLARLGVSFPVAFAGVVGDDRDGDDIARALEEDGVTAAPYLVRAAGARTSRSLVLLDARDGSRTLANHDGGLPPLPVPFSPHLHDLLSGARLLHLDGRDLPAALEAARIVRASGGSVSFDLGTLRPGRDALFPLCDIVLASRRGGAGAFPNAATPEEQVQRFLAAGARIAGVTLGHAGVVVGSSAVPPTRLPAFSVPNVVDTCGAGDTFHGAFLWAHLQGQSLLDCARWAQAAVAVRITRLGNAAGLPTQTEIEAFLSWQSFDIPLLGV